MPNSSTVSGVSPTISGSKNLMPCTQERGRDLQAGVCMDVRVCVCVRARVYACASWHCWHRTTAGGNRGAAACRIGTTEPLSATSKGGKLEKKGLQAPLAVA